MQDRQRPELAGKRLILLPVPDIQVDESTALGMRVGQEVL